MLCVVFAKENYMPNKPSTLYLMMGVMESIFGTQILCTYLDELMMSFNSGYMIIIVSCTLNYVYARLVRAKKD